MVSMQRKPTAEKPPKEGAFSLHWHRSLVTLCVCVVLFREELKQLPYTVKNCALVYAHLNRMHDEVRRMC
jgi:hypothetical protein